MKHDKVTIVIPSVKKEIKTLGSLRSCPFPFDVVVCRDAGLGKCRNSGAAKADGGLIVMVDDDLKLDCEVWRYVSDLKPGEFAMTFLSGFPCSRLFVIHSSDFWRVGGFDNSIVYTGEDRDFYVRALEAGLRFKRVPLSLVYHFEHPHRHRNIHVAVGAVGENMRFLVKYFRRYPEVFKVDFWNRIRRFQVRTLLLEAVFMVYYIIKGEKMET